VEDLAAAFASLEAEVVEAVPLSTEASHLLAIDVNFQTCPACLSACLPAWECLPGNACLPGTGIVFPEMPAWDCLHGDACLECLECPTRHTQDKPCIPASTHLQAQYVEALMKLRGQVALFEQAGGIALLLTGNKGADMHAQGSDPKRQQQLRDAVVAHEKKLQILPRKFPAAIHCCHYCRCLPLYTSALMPAGLP
jgi:hypothetical protein